MILSSSPCFDWAIFVDMGHNWSMFGKHFPSFVETRRPGTGNWFSCRKFSFAGQLPTCQLSCRWCSCREPARRPVTLSIPTHTFNCLCHRKMYQCFICCKLSVIVSIFLTSLWQIISLIIEITFVSLFLVRFLKLLYFLASFPVIVILDTPSHVNYNLMSHIAIINF